MKNKRIFWSLLIALTLLDAVLLVLFSSRITLSLYSAVPFFGIALLLLIAQTMTHGSTYSTGVNLTKDETELFSKGYKDATVLFLIPSLLFVFFFDGNTKILLNVLYLVISVFFSALVGKATAKETVKLRLQQEKLEQQEQIAREEGLFFKK